MRIHCELEETALIDNANLANSSSNLLRITAVAVRFAGELQVRILSFCELFVMFSVPKNSIMNSNKYRGNRLGSHFCVTVVVVTCKTIAIASAKSFWYTIKSKPIGTNIIRYRPR